MYVSCSDGLSRFGAIGSTSKVLVRPVIFKKRTKGMRGKKRIFDFQVDTVNPSL